MALADDEIRITVRNTVILLRPTLRAAMRLERKHKGFDRMIAAVLDGSFAVILDVIQECSDRRDASILVTFHGLGTHGSLSRLCADLAPALVSVVFSMAGVKQDDPSAASTAEVAKITFAQFHERLFKIATGWLGWTPETAWNATPAEITAAYAGKIEMLQAIHGKADTPAEPHSDLSLDDKFRQTFRGIGTKVVRRETPKAA